MLGDEAQTHRHVPDRRANTQRPFSPYGPRSDRWYHRGGRLGSPRHGVRRAGWSACSQRTVRELRTAAGLRIVGLVPAASPRTDGDRRRLDRDGDRTFEQREREPGARFGGNARPACRRRLCPWRSAAGRVRGEFLVATGPFGLRHRGGARDRGQPVGKNSWLRRQRGHVLPARCPRDHQPWQNPGTDSARCCIVSRIVGTPTSGRTALASGADCRRARLSRPRACSTCPPTELP